MPMVLTLLVVACLLLLAMFHQLQDLTLLRARKVIRRIEFRQAHMPRDEVFARAVRGLRAGLQALETGNARVITDDTLTTFHELSLQAPMFDALFSLQPAVLRRKYRQAIRDSHIRLVRMAAGLADRKA